MSRIILPKTYVGINKPLIFLAGPIRSAPNWQDEAIDILFAIEKDILVASPRRGTKNSLQEYVVKGEEDHFPRQRAWERHYLPIASKNGAIMFWLPGEEKHDCKKVYGAMTRIELGQWMTRYSLDNRHRVCVGGDGNFPEFDTICYDLSKDMEYIEIHDKLEDTCREALRLSKLPVIF